ncbi:LysR family transcriptional regulator [Oceanospirillum sediminis]|uniref:LysR family transcriptional regulator n=1 Tax=Oceanospirillum sediminis TaxID=2760088 RepID=A0A839IS11_9GAMM|nr:LysR family transcriptional regulator [Oceanospirillum sediminis]MBB1488263.1 LysR family transcriptional regulator [Oceanospirillum sediminis]
MDLSLLRTFLEVSKTRHFGQAAQNLHLTQSAVSFRIRQLEEMVGIDLFTRQRNNIRLTVAGERLLPHAENLLAGWQLALQDVGMSEAQDTQLTLGGISNLWGTFLQSILPRLANEFPGLSIRTEINSHQELTRSLLAGRLDIAVVLDPPNSAELENCIIGQIELVLVSHKAGIRLSEIDQAGYVFVDWGTAFNMKNAKLFRTPVMPILHTEQSQIALEFLITYGGVAFLPLALVEPYLVNQDLYLVSEAESVSREVYAVYGRQNSGDQDLISVINKLVEFELKPQANLQPSEAR